MPAQPLLRLHLRLHVVSPNVRVVPVVQVVNSIKTMPVTRSADKANSATAADSLEASSRRSSPRWSPPHATGGAATSSARPHTRGSARSVDDLQHQYDTVSKIPGVAPLMKIYKKAGVEVPLNWPPGLIFTGELNVVKWPGYDDMRKWLWINIPELNAKVQIKHSPGRGMGLFAAQNLRRNETVGYYSGILRLQQVFHTSEYVVTCRLEGEEEGDNKWVIDAEYGGNEMRFSNYPSKNEEENMDANYLIKDNRQVIVFTMKTDVKKGEELLWDYGDD